MKRSVIIFTFLLFPFILLQGNSDKKVKAFSKSVEHEVKGEYNEALTSIMAVYRDNEEDYLINLRIGWIYYLLADYENSVKYYQEALRLSGSSTEALIGITYPYSAQGKWDIIKDIYNQILDKDPMNYTANLRMGQIYFYAEDYLNARRIFEKVFKELPSDFELNLFLGWTNYYLGNKSDAKIFFTTALMISPKNESANEGMSLLK